MIRIEASDVLTYADACIVCDEPERWNGRDNVLVNAVAIIEVVSKATESYDRGQKFRFYRDVPTLKEYIIVSSLEVLVERNTKQSTGFWTLRETRDIRSEFVIESIGFSCPVKDLYRNVQGIPGL